MYENERCVRGVDVSRCVGIWKCDMWCVGVCGCMCVDWMFVCVYVCACVCEWE